MQVAFWTSTTCPLPQLASDHLILIVSLCHWKAIIENIIQPKTSSLASAANLFPVWKIHEDNSHWQLRRLVHNMFRINSVSCVAKYMCKILQSITTKTTFGNRSQIAAQEIEPNQTNTESWPWTNKLRLFKIVQEPNQSLRSEMWNGNLVHSFREVKSEMKIWFTHLPSGKYWYFVFYIV